MAAESHHATDRRRARNDRRTLLRAHALWDGTGAPAIRDAALAIEGDRIIYVGTHAEAMERKIANRTDYDEIVDLPSAMLLPAFIDSHIHLSDDGWMPLRLLAYGITTIRDTGNNHKALVRLRERQMRGDWTGPRIRTFGPLIDSAPPHWPHVAEPVTDAADVDSMLDRLVAEGVDGLKVYVRATSDIFGRVADYARKHEIDVTCHGGRCMASEALECGVGCVEHVWSLDVLDKDEMWADLDMDAFRTLDLINAFLRTGAHFTPTLAVMEAGEHGWGNRFAQFPGYDEYPGYLRFWLAGLVNGASWNEERIAAATRGFSRMQALVKVLHETGIPLLAGSDAPFVPVGAGFHYELELLAEAGIPTDAVLGMATREGARYLHLSDKLGVLEPGKLADIVAVFGDPLADIRATRNVEALWMSGRRIDVAALKTKADHVVEHAPSTHSSEMPPFGIPRDDA